MSLVQLHFEQFLQFHDNLVNGKIINQQNDVQPRDNYMSVIQLKGLNIPIPSSATLYEFNKQSYVSMNEANQLIEEYYKKSAQYLLCLTDDYEDYLDIPNALLTTLVQSYIKLFDHVYYYMVTLDQHAIQWNKSTIFTHIEFQLDQMDRIATVLLQSAFQPTDEILKAWIQKIQDYPSMSYPLLFILFNWILESTNLPVFRQIFKSISNEHKPLQSILDVVLSIEPSHFPEFSHFHLFLSNPPTNQPDSLSHIKQVVHYQQDVSTIQSLNALYNPLLQHIYSHIINNYSKYFKSLKDNEKSHFLNILLIITKNADKDVPMLLWEHVKSHYFLQICLDLNPASVHSPAIPFIHLLAAISTNKHHIPMLLSICNNPSYYSYSSLYANIIELSNLNNFTNIQLKSVPSILLLLSNLVDASDTAIINQLITISLTFSTLPVDSNFKSTMYTALSNLCHADTYLFILYHLINSNSLSSLISQISIPMLKLINVILSFPMQPHDEYNTLISTLMQVYYNINAFEQPLLLASALELFKSFHRISVSYATYLTNNKDATHYKQLPGHILYDQYNKWHSNHAHFNKTLNSLLALIYDQTATTICNNEVPLLLHHILGLLTSFDTINTALNDVSNLKTSRVHPYQLFSWTLFNYHNIPSYSIQLLTNMKISLDDLRAITDLPNEQQIPLNDDTYINISQFDYHTVVPTVLEYPAPTPILISFLLWLNNTLKQIPKIQINKSATTTIAMIANLVIPYIPYDIDNDVIRYTASTELIFSINYNLLRIDKEWIYEGDGGRYLSLLKQEPPANEIMSYYAYLSQGWRLLSVSLLALKLTDLPLLQPPQAKTDAPEVAINYYKLIRTAKSPAELTQMIKNEKQQNVVNNSRSTSIAIAFMTHCMTITIYTLPFTQSMLCMHYYHLLDATQLGDITPLLLSICYQLHNMQYPNHDTSGLTSICDHINGLGQDGKELLMVSILLMASVNDPKLQLNDTQSHGVFTAMSINQPISINNPNSIIQQHYKLLLQMTQNQVESPKFMNMHDMTTYKILSLGNELPVMRIKDDLMVKYAKLKSLNFITLRALKNKNDDILTRIVTMTIECPQMSSGVSTVDPLLLYSQSCYLYAMVLKQMILKQHVYNAMHTVDINSILSIIEQGIEYCRGNRLLGNKNGIMGAFQIVEHGIVLLNLVYVPKNAINIENTVQMMLDFILYLYRIYGDKMHLMVHGDIKEVVATNIG